MRSCFRKRYRSQYALSVSVTALLMLGLSPAVHAETAAQIAAQTAAPRSPGQIEEIVVTSQRRAENMQQVPISITAFSATDIAKHGFLTALDLSGQTPNLRIKTAEGFGKPTIFMRGMGFNDFNATAVGAVGVYNDEVYIGGSSNQLFQMFDLQRIEVLRGPQGTLYGRNTTGGAINFISNKPTDELAANGSLTYGRFNEFDADGAISGPLVPGKLTARIAGTYARTDGQEFNQFTDSRTGGFKKWAGRLLLNFTPSDNTSFLFNIHGGHADGSGSLLHMQGLMPGNVDIFGYKETGDFYSGSWDTPNVNQLKTFGASLTAKVTVGGVDFTSISAYEKVNYYDLADSDSGPVDFIQVTYADKQHQFSQEFRAASNGSGPLNWIAGLYYYNEKMSANNLYDIGEFIRDLGVPPNLADPNAPLKIGQPYSQNTDSYAGFGQVTYALNSQLKLNLGLRYTHDKKSIDFRTYAAEPLLGFPPLIDEFNKSQSFNALTGRAGLDFQVTSDAMIYASYNRGYKSGGFNGGALFDPQEATPFNPEHVNAFEAGFKTRWLDGRLTLNGSVFYNEYSNLQVFRFVPSANGLPITLISNAAAAHIKGAELEAVAMPLKGLRIEMGLGLLDAKYSSFQTLAPGAGGTFVPVNLTGNQLVGAPKVTYNGAAEYAVTLPADWVVTPRVQWSYTSHQYFDTSNDPLLSQDKYWLVDASLGLDSPDGRWGLSLWGKNILGQHYNMDIIAMGSFGFNQVVRGTRHTYGMTLRFKY